MLFPQSCSRPPAPCITFWFSASSTIKLLSFSTDFMQRISRLEEDFVSNYISPLNVDTWGKSSWFLGNFYSSTIMMMRCGPQTSSLCSWKYDAFPSR